MSAVGTIFSSLNRGMNTVMLPVARSPRLHRLVSRKIGVVTYTGRRSGQTFSTPVAYTRNGDEVTIGVAMPDEKNWWRNFNADGGAVTLRLRGIDCAGHAVATRNAAGRVWVKVRLDDASRGLRSGR